MKKIVEVRNEIIAFLLEEGEATRERIEYRIKRSETEISGMLGRLRNLGIVKREGYFLAENFNLTRKGKREAKRIKRNRVN